jgi:hypothetical protein
MNFDELKRAINVRETIKLYFIAIDRYNDFVRAYAMEFEGNSRCSWHWRNQQLHDSTAAQHEPTIMKMCGNWFGYNPFNPAHPMRKFFNEHFKKEA